MIFLSYQAIEEYYSTYLWTLDNGCNNHMTGNKSLLSSLDSSFVTNIKIGFDFLVPAKGKGTIHVLTNKNENKFIHEVFYVLHLNVNLISIAQLLQNHYDIRFYHTFCTIYDKHPSKRLIDKVEMTKNIIFLSVSRVPIFHSM